ncbi:MAG TPA: hypothetical protein VJB95_02350, partial [Candidatus Paceibacterota bacterium]
APHGSYSGSTAALRSSPRTRRSVLMSPPRTSITADRSSLAGMFSKTTGFSVVARIARTTYSHEKPPLHTLIFIFSPVLKFF